MQHKLTLTLCGAAILFSGCAAPHPKPVPASSSPRVLFIGNSLKGVNDLPQIMSDVLASAGHAPSKFVTVTPGGMGLCYHIESPDTLRVIDEGNWDIVILQPKSSGAALCRQFADARNYLLKSTAALYDRIKAHSPQAQIILCQTWAPHANYWKNPRANRSIGNNPAEVQARIDKWDKNAAAQRDGFIVAPVGDAWELNYENRKAVRLHADDNFNPNYEGSYLAALVIYGALYHPPSLNVPYHGDLSAAKTQHLQAIATRATRHAAREQADQAPAAATNHFPPGRIAAFQVAH